jgi:hypothetical protein
MEVGFYPVPNAQRATPQNEIQKMFVAPAVKWRARCAGAMSMAQRGGC